MMNASSGPSIVRRIVVYSQLIIFVHLNARVDSLARIQTHPALVPIAIVALMSKTVHFFVPVTVRLGSAIISGELFLLGTHVEMQTKLSGANLKAVYSSVVPACAFTLNVYCAPYTAHRLQATVDGANVLVTRWFRRYQHTAMSDPKREKHSSYDTAGAYSRTIVEVSSTSLIRLLFL